MLSFDFHVCIDDSCISLGSVSCSTFFNCSDSRLSSALKDPHNSLLFDVFLKSVCEDLTFDSEYSEFDSLFEEVKK